MAEPSIVVDYVIKNPNNATGTYNVYFRDLDPDGDGQEIIDSFYEGVRRKISPIDWNADSTSPVYIENKPTIPAAQIQADWSVNDSSNVAYILHKPDFISSISITAVYANDNSATSIGEISFEKNGISTTAELFIPTIEILPSISASSEVIIDGETATFSNIDLGTINGTHLYAPASIATGEVSVTANYSAGTQIATINETDIYVPDAVKAAKTVSPMEFIHYQTSGMSEEQVLSSSVNNAKFQEINTFGINFNTYITELEYLYIDSSHTQSLYDALLVIRNEIRNNKSAYLIIGNRHILITGEKTYYLGAVEPLTIFECSFLSNNDYYDLFFDSNGTYVNQRTSMTAAERLSKITVENKPVSIIFDMATDNGTVYFVSDISSS